MLFVLVLCLRCKETEEVTFRLLEEDIVLATQQEVNEFAARKITYLIGDLIIGDPFQFIPTDITDLGGFGITHSH